MNMPFQTFDEQSDASQCAPRLSALRAELAARRLDGFLVPRADEHQGEYVPKRAERLAWLTGFTGSAGQAVVLMEKAAIFVDRRYPLQGRNQTDTKLFETLDSVNDGTANWIEANLPKGAKLGYDPWLHTQSGVERLKISVERAGGQLVACRSNPLDAVWADQPEPPRARAVPHPIELAGETSQAKRARLAQDLKKRSADAAILTMPDSVCWLLNIRGTDVPHTPFVLAFAILSADASVELFMDAKKSSPELLAHLGNEVQLRAPADFEPALDALQGKTASVDPVWAAAAIFQRLEQAGALKDVSFDSISAAGPHGAIVHYRVTRKTNRRIESGQLFLIDSGAQFVDGTTDVTRTVAVGEPTTEMRDRFTRVLKGHIHLALARFPEGTTGAQLDAFARRPLWDAGLDYGHGTGHGVGSYLSVHEGPQSISSRGVGQALKPGMICSNEPGYYKAGEYGIRIENLVVVRAPAEISRGDGAGDGQ